MFRHTLPTHGSTEQIDERNDAQGARNAVIRSPRHLFNASLIACMEQCEYDP